MAMSQLGLYFLGGLALIATGAVALEIPRESRVVMAVLGAVFWGAMGLSAFDVRAEAWAGARPMPALAYLGITLALLTFVLGLYQVALLLGDKSDATASAGFTDAFR